MALNSGATILPGRGTVFVGDPDEVPPTKTELMQISPAAPPTGFECLGHTSRENTVALSKDGGDATQLGSWWDEAIRSSFEATTWSLTVNSLQVDELTLGLAFGGGTVGDGYFEFDTPIPQNKSLLVLMVDASSRMGLYLPNVTITLGDAPEIAVDAFFEIQLAGQILNSEESGKRMRFIKPSLVAAGG